MKQKIETARTKSEQRKLNIINITVHIFIFDIIDMKPMNITIKDNIIHDNSNAPNAPYPCFVHVILV